MDCEASMDHLLERMLLDPSAEPTNLPMSLLKTITDNFSDDAKIGYGGFAAVYRGVLQNGTVIAVKKLFQTLDMDEEKFTKEVGCLMNAKHKNIVRFLGYCSDTQGKILSYERKMIHAKERQRLLCFEYLSEGSLDKYITDVSEGLEWRTRYKIIEGICEGLHYLHQDIHIVHSDLKPANILLDENMVPKIADFGLARCFDGNQSKIMASKVMGTMGYLAPESYDGMITFKSDIYSLGVMIMEILTGRKGYCDIQNVLQSWSIRFKPSQEADIWLEQVSVCAEIGRQCIDLNPAHRPDTLNIIGKLDQMEGKCGLIEADICASSATQELDVYPLDILIPFEQDKSIKCPVTLTNKTDDLIGVCIKPTNLDACSNPGYPYVWESEFINDDIISSSSLFRMLGPHSSKTIYMTMRKQEQLPLQSDEGMFDVVMVTTKSSLEDLKCLEQYWNHGTWRRDKSEDPLRGVEEFGTVQHRATLKAAVTHDPACQDVQVHHQFVQVREHGFIYRTDVHPTEPWLLVLDGPTDVSIWNYKTKKRIKRFEATDLQPFNGDWMVMSIKFIAGKWFAAGHYDGFVHVLDYNSPYGNGTTTVKAFKAHSSCVEYFAVQPKHTLLLTASRDGESIKLWDWRQEWTCVRVIDTYAARDLTVGPRDYIGISTSTTNNYGLTWVRNCKVWDIPFPTTGNSDFHPDAISTFEGASKFIFYADSQRVFLATLCFDNRDTNVKIWDVQTKKHIHTLRSEILKWEFHDIACHPTLPILAGIMSSRDESETQQIVLWNVRTYRVMKRIELLVKGIFKTMVFNGRKDITSLVVTSDEDISIIKINVPTLLTGSATLI